MWKDFIFQKSSGFLSLAEVTCDSHVKVQPNLVVLVAKTKSSFKCIFGTFVNMRSSD